MEIRRKDENEVEIKVIDRGLGISAEDLNRVFEPFFRTKRNWRSVGLGLTVCYQIIKEHKGMIRFESELGKGTTVIINLPTS